MTNLFTNLSKNVLCTVNGPRMDRHNIENGPMKMRKICAVLVMLLCLGVGNVWGTDYTMYNGTSFNSSWSKTSRAVTATYASGYSVQIMGENKGTYGEIWSNITFTGVTAISINATASNAQSLTLYYSANGSSWTAIATTTSISKNSSSYSDYNVSITGLPSTAVYLKFRSSGNSVYIKTISITTSTGYTLTFKEWDGGGAASGSPSTGSVTANATSFSFGATAPSKTGHTIEGFYTNTSASSGVKVANSSRQFVASVASWTNASSQYTKGANANLYIKWSPASYTITSTLSNCSWSSAISSPYTYTGDANAIVCTVNPSSGYGCPDNITVTMGGSTLTKTTDYTWSVTNGVGSFTLKKVITGNVAITITATPMVTWMAGGEVFSTQRGAANTALTNPGTPASATYCDGVKTFVGWTATPIVGSTDTEPSDLFSSAEATSLKIPAGGATYYAVFASVSGTYGKYKRVTSSSASTDIAAGQYIAIVAYNSHSSYQSWQILGVTAAKNGYDYSSAPSETSSQINEPDRRFLWKISKTSGYWVFSSKHSTSKKIATSGNSSGSALNWSTQTYSKWEYGSNSAESNTFYLRLYDNSSITNCGLQRYNTSWQIYYNSPSYVYNTSAAFKIKFYVPAYTCSNYCTTCCTPLASINGSVKVISGTSATLKWDVLSNVDGTTPYTVTVSPSAGTTVGGISTVDGYKNCTITGLTAGTEYTFTINAFGDASHCNSSQEVVATTPKITLGSASGTSTYIEGYGPGSKQTFTVTAVGLTGNLTVTAPTNFAVCATENGTYTSSITLTPTSGAVSTTVYFRLVTDKTAASSPYEGNITVSGGSATEQTVAVNGTVSPSCHTPTISGQPAASASYNMNVTATALSVTAAKGDVSDPTLTYQWYSNTANSKTTPEPSPIDGATSSSYTPPTTATGTKYYFCEVSSGACAVTSNISAITVNTPTITVSETSRAFGDRAKDGSYEMTFTVSGSNLAKDAGISLALGGTNAGMFSIDKTSVAQTSVGVVSETTITVTYHPTANGSHSATITISSTGVANKTVTLSGTSKNAATVILHVAGSTSTISPELPKQTWLEGDSYTLPAEAAECPEMGLYGWYTTDYEHAITAPSGANFSSPGTNKTLAAGANNFYAVYATVGDLADTYTKITTAGELTTGDYLIVGTSWTTMYAMKNAYQSSESTMADEERSVTSNQISNPASTKPEFIWHFTKSTNTITIYSENNSKYFGFTSNHVALMNSSQDLSYEVSDGKWAIYAGSDYLTYDSYFKRGASKVYDAFLFKRDQSISGPYTTSPNCTTHSLSTGVTPISTGTAVAAKTVVGEGKTTTVTATPSDHYVFSYWTISGEGSTMSNTADGKSTDNPVTITMGTDDATLTAHFTEKEKCTVVFKNNGTQLSSTTYWRGENPVAPTLTDGTSGDACDATSDTHYGWTKTAWPNTIASKSTIDAKTGAETVYAKATTLPAITAGDDGTTITYHAVWAEGVGVPSNEWQLVTSTSSLSAGDKVVIGHNNTGTIWLLGYQYITPDATDAKRYYNRKYASNTETVSDSKITLTSDEIATATGNTSKPYVLTIGKSGDYWTFYDDVYEGYLYAAGVDNSSDVEHYNKNLLYYQAVLTDAGKWALTINSTTGAATIVSQTTSGTTRKNLQRNGTAADGVFSCYPTQTDPYIYKNLSTTGYQTFLTTCCDKNVTLATNSPSHGTITFSPSGTISTCGADAATRQTTMTVTPNTGYYLSSWSTTGVTPASLSTDIAYGSTSNSGAQATTVTFNQNTTTGTYTANATFSPIPVSSLTLHATKKDNTSATIFDETGNNVALSLYPTEGKTASPADLLGHTVKIEFGAVLPANALNKGYTWSATVNGAAVGWSSNDLATNAVLEFNKSSGKVVAKAAGTAEIIITADDGSGITAKVTITVANVALSSLNVAKSSTTLYVGEAEEIAVTYDPVNTTTKGYTTGSYTYVTVGRSYNKITLTGKAVTPGEPERVTLTSSDAGAKTATIDVTVKPLPKVTFVDNLQGKTDFSNWGSDGVVSSTVTDGVVTHTKPTPSHADISDPGASYNACERSHLHLVGWIESTWADAHPSATHEQIVGANVSNGAGTFLESGADFNVETYNGNTYYAVWSIIE